MPRWQNWLAVVSALAALVGSAFFATRRWETAAWLFGMAWLSLWLSVL